MVEWNIVSVIILVIAMILIAILIVKVTGGASKWVEGAFRYIKYTFCCKLMGCQPGWLTISRLNPICNTICAGCACGEAC